MVGSKQQRSSPIASYLTPYELRLHWPSFHLHNMHNNGLPLPILLPLLLLGPKSWTTWAPHRNGPPSSPPTPPTSRGRTPSSPTSLTPLLSTATTTRTTSNILMVWRGLGSPPASLRRLRWRRCPRSQSPRLLPAPARTPRGPGIRREPPSSSPPARRREW